MFFALRYWGALAAAKAATPHLRPVAHVAEVGEIAEGYLYLLRQTYATGQVLVLDGGGLLV